MREALGYHSPHFPLADHYNSDRWMYGDAHKRLVESGDWREHIDLHQHRYMTEDVVLGLAFMDSVAQWAACEAPVARGLLADCGRHPRTRSSPRTAHARRACAGRRLARSDEGVALGRRAVTLPIRVAAVGAGRMGRGIALAFAYGGYEVDLIDLKRAARRSGSVFPVRRGRHGLEPRDARGTRCDSARTPPPVCWAGSICSHSESKALLAKADVVFECVTETLEAKKDVFARICAATRDDAILASTTSTILVTDLIPFRHPSGALAQCPLAESGLRHSLGGTERASGHDTSSGRSLAKPPRGHRQGSRRVRPDARGTSSRACRP